MKGGVNMNHVIVLAAEGATDLITRALANVGEVVKTGTNIVTDNQVALAFVGLSLAGVGVAFFKKLCHR